MSIVKLLTINHLAAHARFFLHGSNLSLFTCMPAPGGHHANAVRTQIIGVRLFVFFVALAVRRLQPHCNNNGESSFLSVVQAVTQIHVLDLNQSRDVSGLTKHWTW